MVTQVLQVGSIRNYDIPVDATRPELPQINRHQHKVAIQPVRHITQRLPASHNDLLRIKACREYKGHHKYTNC